MINFNIVNVLLKDARKAYSVLVKTNDGQVPSSVGKVSR